MYETKPYFYGTGRRKNSVARVRVYTGTCKITTSSSAFPAAVFPVRLAQSATA